jgi:hypothetical protein
MWTTIDSEFHNPPLGELPRDGNVLSLPLPPEIPKTAKEILIYAWVFIGGEINPQNNWHYKIFVNIDEETHQAAFYLYARTDPNIPNDPKFPANTINSSNAWLPMPVDRQLRVRRISQKGGSEAPIVGIYFRSEVRVVAYR